jgi:hypothetical protein
MMLVVMTEAHELIREAAARFLRGETSVMDLTYEFRSALDMLSRTRPLRGREVDLFEALERWETSDGPTGRRSLTACGAWRPRSPNQPMRRNGMRQLSTPLECARVDVGA